MNQIPLPRRGGATTTSFGIGRRNWQTRLYRLALVVPLLVGLQILLTGSLMLVGLLPFELAMISAVQWASIWLGGASATVLIALRAFRVRAPDLQSHGGDSHLPSAIPLRVTHDCVLLARGHRFMAIGYITFAWRSAAKEGRSILETLYQANEAVTLILARTFDEQVHIHLAISKVGDTPESAVKEANHTSEALQRAFEQRGLDARRVADELGVEQLYWLCVLGRAFHEDIQLRPEGRLVAARVGANPPRLLATFELERGTPEELGSERNSVGLLQLVENRQPFLVVVALKPVPPEAVAQQLRQLAARTPEMALLAEALGESTAMRACAESSPAMAEVAMLLAGCKEGLWRTCYRLICTLADAPVMMENLALTPRLLGSRGFTETATTQVRFAGHSVATTSLLNLLGQPHTQRARRREHPRRVQEEVGTGEN